MTKHKERPILLFQAYRDEDFLYLPLTTNLKLSGITVTSSDLQNGQLRKPSVIVVPKVSIIHQSLLLREIGELKAEVFTNVMKKVCEAFACGSYLEHTQ